MKRAVCDTTRTVRDVRLAPACGNPADTTGRANAQFFIMFAPATHLNGQYTAVGEVVSGMEAVDKLKKGPPERKRGMTDPDRIV
jgi:cyclophilin family peptidyl-prolyl cis-trans isomerase